MAKSIRSKAKRKLRAVKREKIATKERSRLWALQEQEDVKMVEEQENSATENENTLAGEKIDATGSRDETMKVINKLKKKKKSSSSKGRKVKRLKKNKYKW